MECLCKLLATIGGLLDASKGQERMEAYFLRLNRLKDVPALEARHRFMIQVGCCARPWAPHHLIKHVTDCPGLPGELRQQACFG